MKTKVSCLLIVSVCVVSAGSAFAVGVEIEDGIDSGLIGYWAFDDLTEGVLRDSARVGLDAGVRGDVLLEDGVFAAAACFKGRHAIRIKANDAFENLPSITISAWVSPKELSGYREIFRKEDGNKRILFSFQNGGRIFNIALTDDQIAKLYEEGLSAIRAKVEGYQEQIENIYEEKVTFAETMAATRRNLKDKNVPSVLMRLVQAKLTVRFSKECADFSKATNSQPFEYLAAIPSQRYPQGL